MTRFTSRFLAAPLISAALLACNACDERSQDNADPGATVGISTAAHGHPANVETCFICEASLRDPARLWCNEHGRYEDRCWDCHPELQDATRLYCDEHGLYEDECFLCDPSRSAAESDEEVSHSAASGGGDALIIDAFNPVSDGLYCAEHDLAESVCAICHPELAATLSPGESLKIRFASVESPRKAGVRTAPARIVSTDGNIEALAESRLNGNRMARVTPLTTGVVQRVLVDVGDSVAAGAPLVELHSTEVASAKAEFLMAHVALDVAEDTLRRESELREKNISAEQDYLAANAAFRRARIEATTARQRLVNLGLTEEQVEQVAAMEDGSATIALRAPFDGEVVAREAVLGEAASPGAHLLTIADRSSMWIDLSFDAQAAGRLEIGAPVRTRFDALPGSVIEGRLVWIDATIDPRSRLLRARAIVENPDRHLKAGLYGEAAVEVSAPEDVVRVPRDAVQHVDGIPFVFVRADDDLFEARRVELAGLRERDADIAAGLAPGEPVVVTGAFTVMSEMLKARLGAGCVH